MYIKLTVNIDYDTYAWIRQEAAGGHVAVAQYLERLLEQAVGGLHPRAASLFAASRCTCHTGACARRPIEEYGVTVRVSNILRRAGFVVCEQIATMSDADLLAVRNLGRIGVAEVRDVFPYAGPLVLRPSVLPTRTWAILTARYQDASGAISPIPQKTYKQVGAAFGIGGCRVAQIIQHAARQLRAAQRRARREGRAVWPDWTYFGHIVPDL